MGSVIRVLVEQQVGGGTVMSHPTCRPSARFSSLFLALRAAMSIPGLRRGDIVHVHLAEGGAVVREGALVLLARLLGKSTVVTIHGSGFLPFAHKHRSLVSRVLRCARLITCLDRDVHSLVRHLAPSVQVELVPNPVMMDEDSRGADETDELVVFGGEIGLRKGADVLCRAWRLVAKARPEARCIMVGPIHDFAVSESERLDVRRSVDATAMKAMLRSSRVVVLPSRAEGMPMLLTEAMGAGRPFVSTPVGGIPDLAQRGGVLVPVGNHVDLAKHLIEFLADPTLARGVGEQGRQYCLETRSVAVIDARLRALYATVSHDRR
jgi:glycosyltransferase involved in cell wall biosynthesis